jgi:hypothetical protein
MIRINARRMLLVFLAIDVAFVLLYVVSQMTQKLEVPLNLDGEANVPAWYAGVQLLLIAFPATIRGLQMRQENPASYWKIYILAAIAFVFLSADEIGTIHESLRPILTERLGRVQYGDGKSAAGLVVAAIYGVIAVVLALMFHKQAWQFLLERAGRLPIIVGVALFGIGAVAIDEFMPYNQPVLEHAAEELFELCGTSLVLYGFLLKLKPVQIEVSPANAS